jgi:hypothetical protein
VNVASLKSRRALFIISLLGAIVLMAAGHAKIIATGDNECGRGVPYDLVCHYVSDFAKHPEYGWMVKTAIGLFCISIAIILLDYGGVMIAGAHPLRLAWLGFIGSSMIGGLALVALYDNRSMTWWAGVQDGVYRMYSWVGLPNWLFMQEVLGVSDKTKDRLHDAGFALFALGFVLLVITSAWLKKTSGLGIARKTLVFLVIGLSLIVWASCLEKYLPGIPQRILLIAIAGWIVASHVRYSGPKSADQSLNPHSSS